MKGLDIGNKIFNTTSLICSLVHQLTQIAETLTVNGRTHTHTHTHTLTEHRCILGTCEGWVSTSEKKIITLRVQKTSYMQQTRKIIGYLPFTWTLLTSSIGFKMTVFLKYYSFSTFKKFPKNLTFFTPWYAHISVRVMG